ncbi:Uncharacterised protein [Vibrio cholerae]|nr:Uncharacterised protein [Vibrio cholerae]
MYQATIKKCQSFVVHMKFKQLECQIPYSPKLILLAAIAFRIFSASRI